MSEHAQSAISRLLSWVVVSATLLIVGGVQADPASEERRQMKGLDEQVQEIKSDVLEITEELSRLEEKLLYPSGTQVAFFVRLTEDNTARVDAVRLQVDGRLVAHYLYSARELEAMRKGGVQRLWVGNVATGTHDIEIVVDGKLTDGEDFNSTQRFTVDKGVGPKLVGMALAAPGARDPAIRLEDW
ncbi:MAG: hypothetical protein OEV00_00070 [Acidobacteriota bacterium]|nr:hypothetical protein [Acidobacteriota bacterium]MDH3783699.1 hypothetical protein [Acidobacteriota bacterium]